MNAAESHNTTSHTNEHEIDFITYATKYYARPSGNEDPYPME